MKCLGWNASPGTACARAFLLSSLVLSPALLQALVADLEAFATPMESIFLRWTDISANETGFRIERKTADGEFSEIAVTPPGAIHFTDTGLSSENNYSYRVSAVIPGQDPPGRLVEVATPPEWAVPRAFPQVEAVTSQGVVLAYEGGGALYRERTTTDFLEWEPHGDPVFLGPLDSREVEIAFAAAPFFLQVTSEAREHPVSVGLSMPFEIPPEPDGNVYDVTDFGASPIVKTNDDAVGIKVAISIAAPGDTVLIPEGTYTIRQVLEIPSGLTLKGAGMDETLLVTEGIDRAFSIAPESHDIRVTDLAVTYEGEEEELAFGIYVGSARQGRNSYRILIDSLRIERFSVHAVSLRDCHHVLVQNCELLNATNLGGGGHGYGIALNYPTNHDNWIRHNTIGPVIRHAVLIQYEAHNNLVERNLAVENSEDAYDLHGEDEYLNELRFNIARDGQRDGFGVGNTGSTHDRSGPNNWIHHNTVENCLAGLEVIQGSDIVFVDSNTFSGNEYGIRVHNQGGNHLYLRDNVLENNETGISLGSARWVWILDNQISGSSRYGIEILAGVEDLTDEGNSFSGNASDYRP